MCGLGFCVLGSQSTLPPFLNRNISECRGLRNILGFGAGFIICNAIGKRFANLYSQGISCEVSHKNKREWGLCLFFKNWNLNLRGSLEIDQGVCCEPKSRGIWICCHQEMWFRKRLYISYTICGRETKGVVYLRRSVKSSFVTLLSYLFVAVYVSLWIKNHKFKGLNTKTPLQLLHIYYKCCLKRSH